MPKITDELIAAVQLYCVAQAYTQTVRPIVKEYQRKVLYILQPKHIETGEVITDPKHTYLMSDEDFALYMRDCNELRERAGFKVPSPEYCPLLMAESQETDAEHLVIKNAEYFTGVTAHQALCHHPGVETMHKLSDLIVKLVFGYAKDHNIEMNLIKKSKAA